MCVCACVIALVFASVAFLAPSCSILFAVSAVVMPIKVCRFPELYVIRQHYLYSVIHNRALLVMKQI